MAQGKEFRQYHVSVHKSGGYRYASTQPTRINPVTKKKECKHIHWGSLTEDNKFYPNKNFYRATPEERAQLIFPDDWDLSELEKTSDAEWTDGKTEWKYQRLLSTLSPEERAVIYEGVRRETGSGVRKLIEALEAEGLTSDRIINVIKQVES